MLIDAKNIGIKLMPVTIAPTIITLDMAFVTDISGECSAGVTFQTTK